jgi:hypothetical protein
MGESKNILNVRLFNGEKIADLKVYKQCSSDQSAPSFPYEATIKK